MNLKQSLGNTTGKNVKLLALYFIQEVYDAWWRRRCWLHIIFSSLINMILCEQSVLHITLGARECSEVTCESPVHILTFQQLRDMLTPTALQRSELDPSAHCPAAPPYSAGSDDESEWPLQMVLPRQRTTKHHSHLMVSSMYLLAIFLLPSRRDIGVRRLKNGHTATEYYIRDPLVPRENTSPSKQDWCYWGTSCFSSCSIC